MRELSLILDQGGHSSRALVFDSTGDNVAFAQSPVATSWSGGGRVEQSPLDILTSLRKVLADIADILADRLALVTRAGLVTQRSSMVCWDGPSGQALSPVLSWQDTRAAEELEKLNLDCEDISLKTGLRPNAHYGASKMRWCLENLPEVKRALETGRLICGPLVSFLVNRLTVEKHLAVDPGNASRTMLWNIQTGNWDADLMLRFGISPSILPPLQPTLSDFGTVTIGGRRVPLQLVNGDQCAAFYGFGPLHGNRLYANAGTGAFIACSWPDKIPVPFGLLKTPIRDDGDRREFVAEGTVNGAAAALDWAVGRLELSSWQELDQWQLDEADLPLFLNGIGGLASPYWIADFPSRFAGTGTARQKLLSVLESIVFLLQDNLRELAGRTGQFEAIYLGGGLARLDSFCSRLAGISGLGVFRAAEIELTGRGAAFQLCRDLSGWSPSAGDWFEPNPGSDAKLRARYARWREAMDKALAIAARPGTS